jgi:hypothetical protein
MVLLGRGHVGATTLSTTTLSIIALDTAMLSIANKPNILSVIILSVIAPSRELYSYCMGYKHIPKIKISGTKI